MVKRINQYGLSILAESVVKVFMSARRTGTSGTLLMARSGHSCKILFSDVETKHKIEDQYAQSLAQEHMWEVCLQSATTINLWESRI